MEGGKDRRRRVCGIPTVKFGQSRLSDLFIFVVKKTTEGQSGNYELQLIGEVWMRSLVLKVLAVDTWATLITL